MDSGRCQDASDSSTLRRREVQGGGPDVCVRGDARRGRRRQGPQHCRESGMFLVKTYSALLHPLLRAVVGLARDDSHGTKHAISSVLRVLCFHPTASPDWTTLISKNPTGLLKSHA